MSRPIAVMLSAIQIVQVGLMMIGFLLETDVEIGFLPISIFEEENPPLYGVPDEERDIQKFSLLCGVNLFMVQLRCG